MADAVEAPPPPPHCGGGSGRSSPSPAASPEFEFWMVGKNPSSFPSPALLTADELFSGGVVLPLHTLQPSPADGEGEDGADVEEDAGSAAPALPPEAPEGEAAEQQPLAESCPAPTPDLPAVTFKWKDIFKAAGGGEAKDRKKVERRVSSVSGNAELININIWPFSRSRSAGHAAGGAAGSLSRAKPSPSPNPNANASTASAPAAPASAARKVSSAPCSRSNSRGESSGPVPVIPAAATAAATAAADEVTAAQAGPPPATTSMLRRLVPGQGRNNTGAGATGIRVGRPSPVWQLRRNKLLQAASAEQKQAGAKKKAAIPTTSDDKDKAAPAAGCRNNAEGGEEGNPPQGLFGLRTFFSKKVY